MSKIFLSDGDLLGHHNAVHDAMSNNPSYANPPAFHEGGVRVTKLLREPNSFADTGATTSTTTKPARSVRRLPPLVCSTKGGDRYVRPPKVQAELHRIVQLAAAQWVVEAENLQSETLVCLIRLAHERHPDVCGSLMQELQKRITHRARRFCQDMDSYDEEQFVDNIEFQVLQLALSKEPTRESGILEVAFGLTLKNLALDERKKFKNSTAGNIADIAVDYTEVDGAEEGEEIERPIEFLRDATSGPEDILLNLDMRQDRHRLLRKALQAIPDPRRREAAILHWGRGIPITSCRRGQKCLTRHFRKDARQIKYWLATAMHDMRAALGL